MKKIIALLILTILISVVEPTVGNAAETRRLLTSAPLNKGVDISQNTYRSNQTVQPEKMTLFFNLAYTVATGHTNSVANSAANLAVNPTLLNNKEIDNVKQLTPIMKGVVNVSLKTTPTLIVKFLDVGQGDAIYIQYPNGKTALVDAGRDESAIESALKAENITRIDTFIATHPDADHIGGAAHLIRNYGVTKVIDGGQKGTTQSYFNYIDSVKANGIPFKFAEISENISDDDNVVAKVLFVDPQPAELNDGSIVILLSYGSNDILITGDAGFKVEEYLINNYNLQAEILKVAHHGADTGTSREFIEAVSPTDAILQYGYNLFGLPHANVVNDLLLSGATIHSTHDRGTITIKANTDSYLVHTGVQQDHTIQTSDQLRITDKDLNGEVVTIQNIGTTPVKMTGWILLSVEGNQSFTFPDGFILNAGEIVKVTSGPNAVDDIRHHLKWTESYIWKNSGDEAKLYDPYRKLNQKLN